MAEKASLEAVATFQLAIDASIALLQPRLVEVRRHLHQHPELSCKEIETSLFLLAQLEAAGIPARLGQEGLGVIADLNWGLCDADSPRIALRADIDALPIFDAKTCDYKSQVAGRCHACGHDAHATMALGAVLAAKETSFELERVGLGCRLRVIFQPAEENSWGARAMVAQGAVDNTRMIFALHVDPERAAGQVGIRYGALTANCDEVHISIEGRGGHSARPNQTDDVIATAAQLVTSLYNWLPRAGDCRAPAVFSIGKLAGGHACNVIPERVEMMGTLRTTDAATRQTMLRRLKEILDGVATASGTRITLSIPGADDAVINDRLAMICLHEAARSVVGEGGCQLVDLPSMGAEDFGGYMAHAPGAMLRLGAAIPGRSPSPPLHSTDFDIDEAALAIGSRILLRAVLEAVVRSA
jgi:amidohydrolase